MERVFGLVWRRHANANPYLHQPCACQWWRKLLGCKLTKPKLQHGAMCGAGKWRLEWLERVLGFLWWRHANPHLH
jgi:hypothetical protein